MKKMSKKDLERKIKQMSKIMDDALSAIDDFIDLEVDTSMCDRDRYNDLLRAEGRLHIIMNYLKK